MPGHACRHRRGSPFERSVNLGDDADTTGAVYGQIAGAFYGEAGIPADWRAKLAMRELIEQRADELYGLAAGG